MKAITITEKTEFSNDDNNIKKKETFELRIKYVLLILSFPLLSVVGTMNNNVKELSVFFCLKVLLK